MWKKIRKEEAKEGSHRQPITNWRQGSHLTRNHQQKDLQIKENLSEFHIPNCSSIHGSQPPPPPPIFMFCLFNFVLQWNCERDSWKRTEIVFFMYGVK